MNAKKREDLIYINTIIFVIIIMAIGALILLSPAPPGEKVSVHRVIDGDTFVLETGERIRLYGVNTPEKGENGFLSALSFTSDQVFSHTVRIERQYKDKYGRTVALVWVGPKSLNGLLVKKGHAEIMERYCHLSICDEWR